MTELRVTHGHITNLFTVHKSIYNLYIMCLYNNISKECFQQLVKSMPYRIKAVLKAKGGQTQF